MIIINNKIYNICNIYIFIEAQASIAAGMSSIILIREGNAPLSEEEKSEFKHINNFDQLKFD